MSPSILNSKNNVKTKILNKKYKQAKETIAEYQKFVKDNFDYVGENFAHEARSIHYKNKKSSKGIYGTATKEDLKALKEEGIITETLPWIKNTAN